ncbi:tetratricopeptide repeat protein [Candidatus Dependentiae bacterium]|nr:tetratricopeptide repeat protein [Candidatus Dependentiae bacterium]
MANFVFNVSTENFYEGVVQKSSATPVLVEFWSERFNGSKILKQTLIKITNELNGKLLLGLVNVDEEQQIAAYLQLTTVPDVKLFISGNVADEFSGALTEQQVKNFLKKYVVSETENSLDSIKEKIKKLDIDGIETELLNMYKKDKNNDKISICLIKYFLLTGNIEKADEISQNIVDSDAKFLIEAIDYWKLHEKLDTINFKKHKSETYEDKLLYSLFLIKEQKDFKSALEQLSELVSLNKNYNNQIARKAMVSIFTILESGPLVESFRNKLYNLIF